MALTKQKKNEVVADVASLLSSSKMTVIAAYPGTTVKAMQALRKQARGNGTQMRVVKNRLVIKAIQQNDQLKSADTAALNGQLLYAFNSEAEAAPAQIIANFANTSPTLEFVRAITADAKFLSYYEVNASSALT